MPRINLLPIKAARRLDSARNELLVVVALVLTTVVGLVAWYFSVEAEVTEAEQNLTQVQAEIERLGKEVEKVESLRGKEKKAQTKIGVIDQLIAAKTGPVRVLDELATILTHESKRVWLVKLNYRDGVLEMQGGAMDHEDISEFQLALERRGMFSNVRLGKISTAGDDRGPKGPKDIKVKHLRWQLSCNATYKAG